MLTSTVALTIFAAVATAAPSLSPRQGGAFVAVGNKYRHTGCVDKDLIFADPVFGNGNQCLPLDRSGTGEKIYSYYPTSENAGCSVFLYTGAGCTGTEYYAPLDKCASSNEPADSFVSVNVVCR